MPMYNLIEYSKNYRNTTGSLCNYYRDELNDETNDVNFPNKDVINSESFKYMTNVTRSTYDVDAKISNAELMKLIILLMIQINLVKKKL